MAKLGEHLQKPIIRDFIESMEPGVPRVEIESRRKENSCVVLMRFKKSLYEEKHLFKASFNISSDNDVKYLRCFLSDIFEQWKFWYYSMIGAAIFFFIFYQNVFFYKFAQLNVDVYFFGQGWVLLGMWE